MAYQIQAVLTDDMSKAEKCMRLSSDLSDVFDLVAQLAELVCPLDTSAEMKLRAAYNCISGAINELDYRVDLINEGIENKAKRDIDA